MSFYSWFLDLMHWKVKQKKCRSVCYHRKPQKCDQCNRRKSAQSTAAWSLSCSAIAMGLTPWCNFHSERGISENTMYVPCTWHQKMVIAWDEVVRVWRDMAPGLVFCDTSLHIHPCYHQGGEVSLEKGEKEREHWFCVVLWLSMPCNMPIPSNKLAECIQHIREAQSHSFCRKITPWPTKVLPHSQNREEFDMYLITMGHMMRVCVIKGWVCSCPAHGIVLSYHMELVHLMIGQCYVDLVRIVHKCRHMVQVLSHSWLSSHEVSVGLVE